MLRTALLFAFLLTNGLANELTISWTNNMLSVHGEHIPGGKIDTWYLEAYCNPNSTHQEWNKTLIPHSTKLVSAAKDGKAIHLRCTVEKNVVVNHHITVEADNQAVAFSIAVENQGERWSNATWAQPCVRVGEFTGTQDDTNKYAYIKQSFVYLDGEPAFMPTKGWGTEARYTPGQVWVPHRVNPANANPRPHNAFPPSNTMIGSVSADKKWVFAVAFDPCQELFQGVIRCIHSDFAIGGLAPGEVQKIKGRMYLMANDLNALEARYRRDFPKGTWTGPDKRKDFREHEIEGWTCLVHPELDAEPKLWRKMRAELVRQFREIKRVLPARATAKLQEHPVWLERKHPRHPCACYHPSGEWLEENHFTPEKEGGVEIANPHAFLDWVKGQPYMMLHELAHGYHDKVLSYDHEGVDAAYKAALEKGLYGEVDTYRTAETGKKRVHYASTNNREYFAEATEAYFGKNDFYPFTRDQLKAYDPGAFDMVEKLWGVPQKP